MQIARCELRTVEFRGSGERLTADAALDPNLVDTRLLPIGEEADTIAARLDGVEVVLHLREGQILIDVLANRVGWLNVERDARDDPESTEPNDSGAEFLSIGRARELDHVAGAGDELDGRHGCREVSIGFAGSMSRGAAGAGDRYVGQRRQIVQGKAMGVEVWTKLPVSDAWLERHGAGVRVNIYLLVHGLHG